MEGFNGAHIIEVLTEKAPKPFIAYCKSIGISYIFAGKEDIDLKVALKKLKKYFGINKLAVCGYRPESCFNKIEKIFWNKQIGCLWWKWN